MKKKLNKGHYFEVMDRAHITIVNMEHSLIDHPALTKRMRKKLEKAQDLICDVYQWAGGKYWGEK